MEFLVRAEIRIPKDLDEVVYEDLFAQELQRGKEMIRDGVIKAGWRLVGRREFLTVFDLPDAAALHDLLSGLPFAPFIVIVSVEPLVPHHHVGPGATQGQ